MYMDFLGAVSVYKDGMALQQYINALKGPEKLESLPAPQELLDQMRDDDEEIVEGTSSIGFEGGW